MKKILSIILTITMLLSMATVAFADETSKIADGTITVGINAEYSPFEYYDENGELTGFDVDLMNYIGERINYDIVYVDMSFDKLFSAVIKGEVDCAISTIMATDERESIVDFTRPYLAANVTYKDGETPTEVLEMYSIVFKKGVADAVYRSSTPTDYEKLFMLVNGTIEELISDGTIEKLISKYDLNHPFDEEALYANGYYEYIVLKSTVTDKEGLAIPKLETWEEATAVPAPSEWAAKDIDFAYAVGIADTDKDYYYKENITREEFCELVYNLIALVSNEITAPVTDSFTDTKNDKILMLNGLGIVSGKTPTEFAPEDFLTREEAATIIMRMINKFFPMPATEMWFEYDDIEEISEWASDSVQTISNLGIMNGVGNNKFAPKDTYTVEQAIVTLVRVLDCAGASGVLDENTSMDIIGGSDGPTSIIVSGADVSTPTEFTVTDTTHVDDFYIDEAIKLITESGELASDKNFISLYTANDDMTNRILALGQVDYNKPKEIFYLSANLEQITANIEALAAAEGIDLEELSDAWREHIRRKLDFSTLASLINSSYGAENLAALTILTNSRGYIMPSDFENNFALFVQYEGDYSAIVSFSEFGDGVISANMSFVKNGDRDNVFSRVYEIVQGLGEGSINFAKVE